MHAAFAKVIALIASGRVEYRDVCIALSQENPELFVKLVEQVQQLTANGVSVQHQKAAPWVHDVCHEIEHNFISAIKIYRAASGNGLKDAKDVIDNVREQLLMRQHDFAPPVLTKPQHIADCAAIVRHYRKTFLSA